MVSQRPRIAVYFASHDGQTRKIVDRLGEFLGMRGVGTTINDLSASACPVIDAEADFVLLAASIRYGVHLPAARRFLARLRIVVPEERIGVVSVNLTARKAGRQTAEGNVYLRNWLKRTGLRPALAAAVAGRLDYPAYRWLDRVMIRAIMSISGGPTDPTTVVEYTNWSEVESLSQKLTNIVMLTP